MIGKALILVPTVGAAVGAALQAVVPEAVPLVPVLLSGMIALQLWTAKKCHNLEVQQARMEERLTNLPTKLEVAQDVIEAMDGLDVRIQRLERTTA